MQVVADTRVHQLGHLQQLEELHFSRKTKADLGVVFERLLALVVFGVCVLHLLREGAAGVFHGRNVLAGRRYGELERVDLIRQ